jgi:hypothetical protein
MLYNAPREANHLLMHAMYMIDGLLWKLNEQTGVLNLERCFGIETVVQVPLHIMFTMPWTPTKQFPHPMAVVQSINVAGAQLTVLYASS